MVGGAIVEGANLLYARRADRRASGADTRDRERFNLETSPRLTVRPSGGLSGDGSDHVYVTAKVSNDGGVASRDAVVEVTMDEQVVGSSEPHDIGPGKTENIRIGGISRAHIVSIHGSGWNFKEGWGVRVRDHGGNEARYSPSESGR